MTTLDSRDPGRKTYKFSGGPLDELVRDLYLLLVGIKEAQKETVEAIAWCAPDCPGTETAIYVTTWQLTEDVGDGQREILGLDFSESAVKAERLRRIAERPDVETCLSRSSGPANSVIWGPWPPLGTG
jgi:hypothetical protein